MEQHTITISSQVYTALQRQAIRSQEPVESLVENWLRQRLDINRYPELEWRPAVGSWRVGIKNTAIDVYTVVGYAHIGYSPQEISVELLPRLSLEQVRAALQYYAEYPAEIDRTLAESDTEAVKARLYRSLGADGYRCLTGSPDVPRIVQE